QLDEMCSAGPSGDVLLTGLRNGLGLSANEGSDDQTVTDRKGREPAIAAEGQVAAVRHDILLILNMIVATLIRERGLGLIRRAMSVLAWSLALLSVTGSKDTFAAGQQQPASGPAQAVERLGKDLFRVGRTRVNTATREVSVTGTVNPVTVLEF